MVRGQFCEIPKRVFVYKVYLLVEVAAIVDILPAVSWPQADVRYMCGMCTRLVVSILDSLLTRGNLLLKINFPHSNYGVIWQISFHHLCQIKWYQNTQEGVVSLPDLILILCSLIPRPSITANAMEGLVKLLRRVMSGRRWEAWHFQWTAVHRAISHASQVHLTSFYVGVYQAFHCVSCDWRPGNVLCTHSSHGPRPKPNPNAHYTGFRPLIAWAQKALCSV